MAGILDFLDDPSLLSSLLGGQPQQQPQPSAPPPPPPPPPQVMAAASPSFAPNSPMGNGGQLTPGAPPLSFNQRAQPTVDAIADGTFDPQSRNYTTFQPSPQAAAGVPLPQPRPASAPDPTANAMGALPPPAPPPSNAAGMPTAGGGSLEEAMGLPNPVNQLIMRQLAQSASPQGQQQQGMQSALAGLGKGLSAVGNLKPGTFGATAFAAGAGGGLQGDVAQQNVQQQQQRGQLQDAMKATNDLINRSSAAFKDIIAGNAAGDSHTLSQARSNYYNAQSALAGLKGAGLPGGSNAWQNSPSGKSLALEKMLDGWEKNQQLQLKAKWQATGSTPEEIKSDLADLTKRKEEERKRRSSALGISPDEYKRGTSKQHSFDMESLTPAQRMQMPDGAWYRYKDPSNQGADKDGYVYKQRDWLSKPPYPGWQPPGSDNTAPQTAPPTAPTPGQVEREDQEASS